MTISPTTFSQNTATSVAATETAAEETSAADAAVGQEEFDTFLTLLTAQIKNQDPLAPLDSTQFVEQLASFTSLELQAKNNVMLESIVSLLTAQQDAQTAPDTSEDISEDA